LSTRSIVKKKRRKPQTSQDKAVATNYHSRQASGKNHNRENFAVFSARRRQGFGATRAIWFNASCLEKFKNAFQTERQFGKGPIQVLRFVAK
jgi:hypothetical protein